MACVVGRVVRLKVAPIDCAVDQFEVRAFNSVVSVKVITCHDYDLGINRTETDLIDCAVLRGHQIDHIVHALLVPVPNDELRFSLRRNGSESCASVVGEISTDKLLSGVLRRA